MSYVQLTKDGETVSIHTEKQWKIEKMLAAGYIIVEQKKARKVEDGIAIEDKPARPKQIKKETDDD